MDLILLDKDFKICGIVEKYTSLRWIRRYFSVGEFELVMSSEYLETAKGAAYIYHTANDETAIIEDVLYISDGGGSLVLSGRMLEALLYDRVIVGTEVYKGNLESILRSVLMENAMVGARKIDKLTLGPSHSFANQVNCQVTGKTLADTYYTLLYPHGMSYKLRYDYLEDRIFFEVYAGVDRSSVQTKNANVIFSSSYENIRSLAYHRNDAEEKNYVTVAGCGLGADRVIYTIDRTSPGKRRRELYVDARDLQKRVYDSEGNESAVSDQEYILMLDERGKEKLKKHSLEETVEVVVEDSARPTYREDFDLGDVCDVIDTSIGFDGRLRLTEVREITAYGTRRTEAVFGEARRTDLNNIWRKEV